MAALSVVQKRLEGIGLGLFCLELHSNKRETAPADENESWFGGQLEACGRVEANADSLKEYLAYRRIADEAEKAGLAALVRYYESGAAHEEVLPAWNRAMLTGLIVLAIKESEPLLSLIHI